MSTNARFEGEPTDCPWCHSTRIMTWLAWPGLWGCYDCLYRWDQGDPSVPSKACDRNHPAMLAAPAAGGRHEQQARNDRAEGTATSPQQAQGGEPTSAIGLNPKRRGT
jgi:hypothetical protein